jgi:translation initiation factor IF-3
VNFLQNPPFIHRYIRQLSTTRQRRSTIANDSRARANQDIRADKVRVVQPDGDHQVVDIDRALEIAREHNLDLVEVAPSADPPVCKIIDYGKYRYEQQKKAKEQKKKSQTVKLKELRFRPNTDTHDFNFKTRHAREFLEDNNKVKAWVQFRGRDIVHKDRGRDLLERFIEELEDISKVDQPPQMEGRRMTLILSPDK